MLFFILTGLYAVTLLFIYSTMLSPQSNGGGDYLGNELGLLIWGAVALSLWLGVVLTGVLRIKNIYSTVSVTVIVCLLGVLLIATTTGLWVYTQVVSSGTDAVEITVETN